METQSEHDKTYIDTMYTSTDTIITKSTEGEVKSIEMSSDTTSKNDKYTAGSHQKHEAPKHNSPEQMKIDSIKKSKEKMKKG